MSSSQNSGNRDRRIMSFRLVRATPQDPVKKFLKRVTRKEKNRGPKI
jgi:hypothetical protein